MKDKEMLRKIRSLEKTIEKLHDTTGYKYRPEISDRMAKNFDAVMEEYLGRRTNELLELYVLAKRRKIEFKPAFEVENN